ncbi:MAG: hypothetical protein NVS4B7_16610 [Ktedonobacteraceae bacterium]
MAKKSVTPSKRSSFGLGTIGGWLMGLLCFGGLGFLLVQLALQFATPTSVHRVQLVQDVVLPSVEVPVQGQPQLQSIRFDHFDFQALDPQTGLLFIAHPGPSDVKLDLLVQLKQLPPGTTFKGTIAVVDTRRNLFVTSIPLPNIHGLVIAPDLHTVYAADSLDDVVYSIDERTFKPTPIDVAPGCASHKATPPLPCENPDSVEYDQTNHRVFAACPGGQNLIVIDAFTNKLLPQRIDLSGDKPADDVGHVHYDPAFDRLFVVVQPFQQNPNDPNSSWPAPKLLAIDPNATTILSFATLPTVCTNAHGMNIDLQQQIAFVACIDSQKLVMVDLRAMKALGGSQPVGFKPDIVALDTTLHVLFVGCASGISVFDERGASAGSVQKFKDYFISTSSAHSIAVDVHTHLLYIPLINVGGRPVLRIEQYNPNGNV